MNTYRFIGRGTRAELEPRIQEIKPWGNRIGPWIRSEDGDSVAVSDEWKSIQHPAGYDADPDLAEAVNTAILLRKPLLLTGKPGVGKSDLAERIAWELNLGPVLRFESQSLSEANDLFYRFDLVGQMAAGQLLSFTRADNLIGKGVDTAQKDAAASVRPELFLTFGALGKAILRSNPTRYPQLFRVAFPDVEQLEAKPSVVLIDEIDKAARDFPNDLLGGIDRFRFTIRELKGAPQVAATDEENLRPIVIISSNSERELPGPFLRRCTYFDIADPDADRLSRILLARVFPERFHGASKSTGHRKLELPKLYQDMLSFFVDYREKFRHDHVHFPGIGELIDWSRAVERTGRAEPESGLAANRTIVHGALSTLAKRDADRKRLLALFNEKFAPAAPTVPTG
jgi:MoxR-like ATPase